MKYEVIESKVWRHKATGRTASIYGACPWIHPGEREEWELEVRGWTVRNPYTNEIGIGREPWATRQAAETFAQSNSPSPIGIGD